MKLHQAFMSMIMSFCTYIVLLVFLFPGNADANYLYNFEFSDLTYNSQVYAADSFSFISPQLIGPTSFIGSPYIDNITLDSPLDLNNYLFSNITPNYYEFDGTPSESSLNYLCFSGQYDNSRPAGSVAGWLAYINFDPGSYGPGVFNSSKFGRGIKVASDGIIWKYTGGTLTISESAVPIPSAAWLLGSGLIGIVGIRRKFKT